MKLTIHYVHMKAPVEISIEGSDLQPEEACRHLHYIVTRVDAEIEKAATLKPRETGGHRLR